MPRMTGGEAVVRSLASEGVRAVFGLPGTHALAMFDALHDAPGIRRITTRHEQGAAYMADGYARASGDVGVCLTSTGPGALNCLSAMATAFADSSPVLNVSSQIPASGIGHSKGYFHDVGDQLGMFGEVTGWRAQAGSPTEIPWLVHEAMRGMRNGRPRPAALEVPKDVLDATADATLPAPAPRSPLAPDPAQIEAAADVLRPARRPVVWAGGGAVAAGASLALTELAETLEAPVITTVTGKGAISEGHPLSVVVPPAHFAPLQSYLAECDVMLVVGSHLSQLDTNEWTMRMPRTIVQVDVDPTEIGRNYPVDVAVVGDAGLVARSLVDALGGSRGERTSRAGEVADLKTAFRRKMEARSPEAVELVDHVQDRRFGRHRRGRRYDVRRVGLHAAGGGRNAVVPLSVGTGDPWRGSSHGHRRRRGAAGPQGTRHLRRRWIPVHGRRACHRRPVRRQRRHAGRQRRQVRHPGTPADGPLRPHCDDRSAQPGLCRDGPSRSAPSA